MNIAETILSRGDVAATAVIHGAVAVTFKEMLLGSDNQEKPPPRMNRPH